jgi:integrase/recombinase XerD
LGDRWGHAVSSDLVHWSELPVALAEENGIMIFTGSTVVDEHNSSGFCADGKPCMVAIYTGHTPETKSRAALQTHLMIRRRAAGVGIKTLIACHTFRATGITAYLKGGGKLEVAQQMAAHESARTTGLYDRRGDEISLDEVERILI